MSTIESVPIEAHWVQCEIYECKKWRKMPAWLQEERFKDLISRPFFCYLNPDLTHADCHDPEETEEPLPAINEPEIKN